MPTPDADDLKERFPIANQIAEKHLDFAIETALSDVEDAIGIDAYNEIFGSAPSTVEDDDADADATNTNETVRRARKVTNAVYYKAFAKVLRSANSRIRAFGSVKREHDASSPAMSGGRQADTEYLSPGEVDEMASWHESEAEKLLQPYLLSDEINYAIECVLVRG